MARLSYANFFKAVGWQLLAIFGAAGNRPAVMSRLTHSQTINWAHRPEERQKTPLRADIDTDSDDDTQSDLFVRSAGFSSDGVSSALFIYRLFRFANREHTLARSVNQSLTPTNTPVQFVLQLDEH